MTDLDRSKILLRSRDGYITGYELGGILREVYHLEMEMETEQYVLGITTVCDTDEGFDRFLRAMREIDDTCQRETRRDLHREIVIDQEWMKPLVQNMRIARAVESEKKLVPLLESEGRVSLLISARGSADSAWRSDNQRTFRYFGEISKTRS